MRIAIAFVFLASLAAASAFSANFYCASKESFQLVSFQYGAGHQKQCAQALNAHVKSCFPDIPTGGLYDFKYVQSSSSDFQKVTSTRFSCGNVASTAVLGGLAADQLYFTPRLDYSALNNGEVPLIN